MTIVEKIKALLAKAASTDNQHEAELFLGKAHELMEKHQLEAHDLETEDPVAGEDYYEKGSTKAAPDWDMMLIFAVAKYFGCKAIRIETRNRKWAMDIVGRESARVTAKEMHSYLVKTVRRLGREAVDTPEFKLTDRWGYDAGFLNADQCTRRIGNALRSRLNELAAAQDRKVSAPTAAGKNALVTVDRVLAVYKERHPDAVPINGRFSTNAGARNIAAGIGLNLQTGSASTLRIGSK